MGPISSVSSSINSFFSNWGESRVSSLTLTIAPTSSHSILSIFRGIDSSFTVAIAAAAAAGVKVELNTLISESESEKREGDCKGGVTAIETDERDDARDKVDAGEGVYTGFMCSGKW